MLLDEVIEAAPYCADEAVEASATFVGIFSDFVGKVWCRAEVCNFDRG